MSTTAGGGAAPAGTAPMSEARKDVIRLLTSVSRFLQIPQANLPSHPVYRVLQKAAIVCFNEDFGPSWISLKFVGFDLVLIVLINELFIYLF